MQENKKGLSRSFTLTCDVRAPPPSHIGVSMRVRQLSAYFHGLDLVVSVRAMCSMLVLGSHVSMCV